MAKNPHDSRKTPETATLAKGLRLMETIASLNDANVSLGRLSEITGWHKSTLHRYLTTLSRLGYLVEDPATGSRKLSLRILKLSTTLLRDMELRKLASPHLQALMLKIRETVHLGVLDRMTGEVVVVDKVDSPHQVRMYSYVGARFPVHSSALGKAILAFLPSQDRGRVIRFGLKRRTARTILTEKRLLEELDSVRSTGFAIDNEENADGIRCVGAPILNYSGSILGAVSVSAPTNRLQVSSLGRVGALVVSVASAISASAAAISDGYR